MQKLVVIVLVGWLAVAKVTKLVAMSDAEKADFTALGDYLHEVRPYYYTKTHDLAMQDLDYLKANFSQLPDGVREAAWAALYLRDRHNESHPANPPCSNELMSIVIKLRDAMESCEGYIIDTYMRARFFDAFNASDSWAHITQRKENLTSGDFYTGLVRMVREVPKYQFHIKNYEEKTVRKDRIMFNLAFDKLLVKTCKSINSDDQLLENMGTLSVVHSYSAYKHQNKTMFWVALNEQMNNMNWSRQVCTRILNMDEAERTRIFDSGTPPAFDLYGF